MYASRVKTLACAFALIATPINASDLNASGKSNFGHVVFVKGDVTHTRFFSIVNPPQKGAVVTEGDVFTTGEDGFVSISFPSGASVNIQPASRISITDVDCIDGLEQCNIALSAEQGEVHSNVTPRLPGERPINFRVITPYLSAAVRGTSFYVDSDQNVDRLGVTSGLVATSANGATNNLPEGKGIKAVMGEDPVIVDLLSPPEFSLPPTCRENFVISNEDIVHWRAVPGAEKYLITYTTDSTIVDPVSIEK